MFLGSFRFWKIDSRDAVNGANLDTFSAQAALFIIDIGKIVGNGDGVKRTNLGAFSATDT